MSRLPLTALRAFEAVVRCGSFAAGAESLRVTQSAVSHQIRQIEDWLGAPLFDRSAGRPQLLPHGAELAQSLKRSFEDMETACSRARRERGTGTLVIAAIPSVAVCWLIPRLAGFRAAHPGIALRLVYALHGQDIDFDDVHLAFTYARGPLATTVAQASPFLPGAAVPVCSTTLATRLGSGPPTADRIATLGLLHDTDKSGWRDWFDHAGFDAQMDADAPVFQDFNLLRAAALSGQGVALCPLAMIGDDLAAGRLLQLSELSVQHDSAYYILTGNGTASHPDKAVQVFRDWAFAAR
ncbi:MAG: LysR substrate-binding domain-containing protein [Paracoccaceae bacterium]